MTPTLPGRRPHERQASDWLIEQRPEPIDIGDPPPAAPVQPAEDEPE